MITAQHISEVQRVMSKYYHLNIPESLIQQVLDTNPGILKEVLNECISDTFARNYLVDIVLNTMDVCAYPCNCDSEEYKDEFLKQLEEKMPEFGVSMFNP